MTARSLVLSAFACLTLTLSACADSAPAAPAVCGNGIVEPGESCDDGNTTSGDGCASNCLIEAGNCGNGVIDPGESCDDGNTVSGDGCDSSCITEAGNCGDGVLNTGEQCDDGNTTPNDGCSENCQNEGAVCGNGVREFGEECDDGNTTPGDGCDANCQLEGSGPFCGNGVRENAEQCDDGNNINGDGCDANCQLEAGNCGNGTLNIGEECDDGNTTPGDGCDGNCDLEGSVCGNGTIEPGEECDDNNILNGDGCSNNCLIERCGDGVLQAGEECDDGNNDAGDGCDATCNAEGPITCGNGVLEIGEECDDGNTTPGDGCDATCNDEQTGLCQPDWQLACNTSDSWDTTFIGSTNEINQYSCVAWNESGREYTYTFVAPVSGNVRVDLSGTTSDLDIFIIDDDGDCSEDDCVAYGDNGASFAATAGQLYYIVVDGYLGAEGPYSVALTCGTCGDGNVDPGEECDDLNTTGGDGCSEGCMLEACGNGVMDTGEQCDDNNNTSGDGCSDICMIEECGNGVLDFGEECDDNNILPGDGCDANCDLEGDACTADFALLCGAADSYSTVSIGSTDVVDSYACSTWDESGREYTYSFTSPVTADVTVALTNLGGIDLDVFVVSDSSGNCISSNCVTFGNSLATFAAVQDEVYYFVVDGFAGAEGSFTIDVTCGGGTCGDGVLNAGEECDDDGVIPGDGCSATCTIEINTCEPEFVVGCNDFDSWSTTGAGSTDNIDNYGGGVCSSTLDESGREYTYAFQPTVDTDLTITMTPEAGVDLDLFLLADDGDLVCMGDECQASSATTGSESISGTFLAGNTFWIVVDGYQGAEGSFTIDFACP